MIKTAQLQTTELRKKMGWLVLLLMGFFVTGCASDPPNCGDKKTIDLLYQIVKQNILPAEYKTLPADLFASKVSLKFPAPTKYEKEIQKYECEAKFVVDASKGADKSGLLLMNTPAKYAAAGWSGSEIDAIANNEIEEDVFTFNVRYTSQDVEGKHIVSVGGIDRAHAFMMGTFIAAHFVPIKQETQPSITYQYTNKYPEVSQSEKDRMAREAGSNALPAENTKTKSNSLPQQEGLECPSESGNMEQAFNCQEEALVNADAELNTTYKALMSVLTQPDQDELRKTQRAWVKHKEQCNTPVGAGANSMLHGIMESECKTKKTNERTKFLLAYKPA